ncbi:hydrolase [Planotetraspora thailandica]|uniref:Hydrolase n=1 Tax=Planotetraspora thailandica TaxID=487172 RepID=A0A8J3V2D9_9ACTN|nr:PHB depolymerase family esterase [Planotetraspora thailandica]GII55466.1 hydrolase [Planotetraspora thailandica]
MRKHTPKLLRATALAALAVSLVGAPAVAAVTPASAEPVRQSSPRGHQSGIVDHQVPTRGCSRQLTGEPGVSEERTIVSGGVTRSYVLHLPAGYRPTKKTPLVMAFHGRKGSGQQIEGFSGISALDAIAVYPQGLIGEGDHTAWQGAPYASGADDVLFVSDLLNELQSTLCVDPARIYVTGKSNGGGFAGVLACRLSRRIAAAAPVSGAFYQAGEENCAPRRAVPILDFHGTADSIVDYLGEPEDGLPPVFDWTAAWAKRDGCDDTAQTIVAKDDITAFQWTGCRAHSEVVHYRIEGGGHTWPGELADSGPGHVTKTISATAVMWDFFKAHPLR